MRCVGLGRTSGEGRATSFWGDVAGCAARRVEGDRDGCGLSARREDSDVDELKSEWKGEVSGSGKGAGVGGRKLNEGVGKGGTNC